jgi:hypothetical protein
MDGAAPPREPKGGLAARLVRRELEGIRDGARRLSRRGRARWTRRPPARRVVAAAFVAALLASGALAVVAQARLPARLPSARDWAAVAAVLEREARPGDALALSPPWAERARAVLPPGVPVLAQRRWAGEDLVGVRRLWLLSLPEAPGFSWELESELMEERAGQPRPTERIGAFQLGRLDLAFPTLPLAFLPDRLAQAEVSRGGEPCAPDGAGGFRCGSGRVAREVRELGGAPRFCLVASLGAGAPLVVAFPPVRVGRLVRGHGGALSAGGAPLRVSVVVEGEEAGSAELSGRGYQAFEIDTTRFAGEARPLSLVLTSAGAGTDVCLAAVTLP